jgi:hypothetical protein
MLIALTLLTFTNSESLIALFFAIRFYFKKETFKLVIVLSFYCLVSAFYFFLSSFLSLFS